jgi:hypothetical protein
MLFLCSGAAHAAWRCKGLKYIQKDVFPFLKDCLGYFYKE